MRQFAIDPGDLEIEITETALLGRDEPLITKTLHALAGMGMRITLDDFGTGNATLTHLKQFPISALKIDKSFIRDIGRDPDNTIITSAIINLAHNLGLNTVAEGVETHEQLSFLRINQCDHLQGFLIAPPLAPEDAAHWLRQQRD